MTPPTDNNPDKQAVVAFVDPGYIVVPSTVWNATYKKAAWLLVIRACLTWSDYRELGNHPFENAVKEAFCRAGEPKDDDHFPTSLPFIDDEGGWDHFIELQKATTRFFENLVVNHELHGLVESEGTLGWVWPENIERITQNLTDFGFTVTEKSFEDW